VQPTEELEKQVSAMALRLMVENAAQGRMNTLRIWGGGVYWPEAFYEACDELGMLVFQDIMFAQVGEGINGLINFFGGGYQLIVLLGRNVASTYANNSL
jgi:hypothetical protein